MIMNHIINHKMHSHSGTLLQLLYNPIASNECYIHKGDSENFRNYILNYLQFKINVKIKVCKNILK